MKLFNFFFENLINYFRTLFFFKKSNWEIFIDINRKKKTIFKIMLQK